MKKTTVQNHRLALKCSSKGMAISMCPTSPNMTPMKNPKVTM